MSEPVSPTQTGVPQWETGTLVGRFTLLTPLAQGGMAEIWLARQSGLRGFEKLVVIKRMVSKLAVEPEYVEMFLTEARLAAGLSHANVVQIYELGEDEDGQPYIVMEYLDGEDLGVVRRTGQKHGKPLPDAYAVKLISLAAEGLHYAHTRVGHDGKPLHIVHRDISPQNLIATMDGGLKVVDFGIAKLTTAETHSGKLKGKIAYMSPEQARGEELDARADVFALGVVMFELLTRTRLAPKMNDLQLLEFMAGDAPFDDPRSRREDLPVDLEAIILRALTRKKEQRFQSARELQDALEAWLVSQQLPVTANDLRDWLRDVFARRIHERRQLIETAIHTDLTPSAAQNLASLAKRNPDTSSRSRSRTEDPKRPGKGLMIAVVGMALLVGAIGVAVWKHQHDESLLPQALAAEVPQPTPQLAALTPPPKPVPPVLIIDTVPTGATLSISGTERGVAPLTLDDLGKGTFTIEAKLEGYVSSQRDVTLEHDGERVRIELALSPEPVKATPVAVKKKAAAPGKLSLKTTPWTTVYLGKKKLGDTPLLNVSLPSGRQVLRLVTPDAREQSIEVDIRPNETTVKKLKL
ncbi:MAG: protein kinase domain-containing protein [Archangium sp.]